MTTFPAAPTSPSSSDIHVLVTPGIAPGKAVLLDDGSIVVGRGSSPAATAATVRAALERLP